MLYKLQDIRLLSISRKTFLQLVLVYKFLFSIQEYYPCIKITKIILYFLIFLMTKSLRNTVYLSPAFSEFIKYATEKDVRFDFIAHSVMSSKYFLISRNDVSTLRVTQMTASFTA